MAEIQMARMSITGVSLTAHARELMGQGEWRPALNFLTRTLGGGDGADGMSIEQAISVLSGDMRLTGADDNIGLEAEEASVKAALLLEYQEVYEQGGYLKVAGKMYEAYGLVDNLGPEDGWAHRELHSERPKSALCGPQWYDRINRVESSCCYPAVFNYEDVSSRAKAYASSPAFDLAYVVMGRDGARVVALFKATDAGATPFWMTPESISPQEAFAPVESSLLRTGYCQARGYDLEDVIAEQLAQDVGRNARELTPAEAAEIDARLKAQDAESLKAKVAFEQRCREVRAAVIAFADNDSEYGWLTYEWANPKAGPDVTLRVPKRALHCYALSVTAFGGLMPEYTAVSDSGLKMPRDNPYHTDVWLGAGFDIDESAYDRNNPSYQALQDLQYMVQKKLLNFEAHVLARGSSLSGKVVFADSLDISSEDVLVVPHGGEEFHVQAMKAGAVICAVGGKVAHLAIVCREMGKSVVRIDDAMTRFYPGQLVTVDSNAGKVVGSNSYQSPAGAF